MTKQQLCRLLWHIGFWLCILYIVGTFLWLGSYAVFTGGYEKERSLGLDVIEEESKLV